MPQFEYKIVLLGEAGVGKTSLFNRIKSGRFHEGQSTQGADRLIYPITVGEDSLSVALWDTGGGERFRTLTNNFYRNADGAMLVYCLEDTYTFENLQEWIDDASHHIDIETFQWALIGNKDDLPNEVEKGRVQTRCEQLQTNLFYCVSAKTGHNVLAAFNDLITTIHSKRIKGHSNQPNKTSAGPRIDSISSQDSGAKKSCCS